MDKKTTSRKRAQKEEPKKGYTKPGYVVPEGEEDTVAVVIEAIQFDQQTGERISKPRTYKTNPRQWVHFLKHYKTQGFTITELLHIPEGAKMIDLDELNKK